MINTCLCCVDGVIYLNTLYFFPKKYSVIIVATEIYIVETGLENEMQRRPISQTSFGNVEVGGGSASLFDPLRQPLTGCMQ